MNKIILPILFISSMLNAHDIKINITEIESTKGKLYIGLYNEEEGFREVEKTYKKIITEISGSAMTVTFTDIPTGTYAVSIFHDENKNGKHDKNIFGIPKEPYGFSNNNRHTFGPASFEESSIKLTNDTNLTITLGE